LGGLGRRQTEQLGQPLRVLDRSLGKERAVGLFSFSVAGATGLPVAFLMAAMMSGAPMRPKWFSPVHRVIVQ
jgi:hypothetical protein